MRIYIINYHVSIILEFLHLHHDFHVFSYNLFIWIGFHKLLHTTFCFVKFVTMRFIKWKIIMFQKDIKMLWNKRKLITKLASLDYGVEEYNCSMEFNHNSIIKCLHCVYVWIKDFKYFLQCVCCLNVFPYARLVIILLLVEMILQ